MFSFVSVIQVIDWLSRPPPKWPKLCLVWPQTNSLLKLMSE